MSQQIQDIWKKFDAAIASAESPDTKAMIEALKAQAELTNMRLAMIEHSLGNLVQMTSQTTMKR